MDLLIAEIIGMFEDRQPSHQLGRERRLARPVGINVAEGLLEKLPIDHPRELHQRMLEVDGLIKSGTEQVGLPAVLQFPRSHRITPAKMILANRITLRCGRESFSEFARNRRSTR